MTTTKEASCEQCDKRIFNDYYVKYDREIETGKYLTEYYCGETCFKNKYFCKCDHCEKISTDLKIKIVGLNKTSFFCNINCYRAKNVNLNISPKEKTAKKDIYGNQIEKSNSEILEEAKQRYLDSKSQLRSEVVSGETPKGNSEAVSKENPKEKSLLDQIAEKAENHLKEQIDQGKLDNDSIKDQLEKNKKLYNELEKNRELYQGKKFEEKEKGIGKTAILERIKNSGLCSAFNYLPGNAMEETDSNWSVYNCRQ